MSWEYRIVHVDGRYAIHEVFYEGDDRSKPRSCSMNPVYPRGEDLVELQEDTRRYLEAMDLPVLTPADFPRWE